jgi:hypothetical protein
VLNKISPSRRLHWSAWTGFTAAAVFYAVVFYVLVLLGPGSAFFLILAGSSAPGILIFLLSAVGVLRIQRRNSFDAIAAFGCASWLWVFMVLTPPGWFILLGLYIIAQTVISIF